MLWLVPNRQQTIIWTSVDPVCQSIYVLPSLNSLAPGRFQFNLRKVILKLTSVNGGWGVSYEIALRWIPQDLTNDKSTLVQAMACCRQATSHYLSQCWPRSMSPNGVTRPQWVTVITGVHSIVSSLPQHTDLNRYTASPTHWVTHHVPRLDMAHPKTNIITS